MTTPPLRYIEIYGTSTKVEAVITGDYLMKTGPVTEARGILQKGRLWTFGKEVIRKAEGFGPKYVLIFAADTGILWSITWTGFGLEKEHVPNSGRHGYGEQWGVHVDHWERLDPRKPQHGTLILEHGRSAKKLCLPNMYNRDQLVVDPTGILLRVGVEGPRGGSRMITLAPEEQDAYYAYHQGGGP